MTENKAKAGRPRRPPTGGSGLDGRRVDTRGMPRPPAPKRTPYYDPACTRCPRLAEFLAESHQRYPEYFTRPVPSFGAESPRVAIVGLAPGMHGANRTGRPFTGDFAGVLLYETLHELGVASSAVSTSADDPLKLKNLRILNAVKCVPPENKPLPDEIRTCNAYLKTELQELTKVRVILALGRVAHDAVLMAEGLKRSQYEFGHGREHALGRAGLHALAERGGAPKGSSAKGEASRYLIDSYHCSRYNTQTRVLTPEMFKTVVARACELAEL